MKYLGNTPTLEFVHEFAHKFDYMVAGNPTLTINPAVQWATWLNTLTGNVFVCISNLPNNNIWKSLTSNRWNGALVWNNAVQSIPTGSDTPATHTTAAYDTAGFWSVLAPTRLTIPNIGVTKVRLQAAAMFAAHASATRRGVSIMKNGSGSNFYAGRALTYIDIGTLNNTAYLQTQTPIIDVSPGDYFEVSLYQNSGGSLNTVASGANFPWFAIEAIE